MGVIGVGVDVADVARMAEALDRTPGLADRLFLPAELAYADADAARLAARFAAKEAAAKALGVRGFRAHDVEVTNRGAGQPGLIVTGELARRAGELGVSTWHVSLSHDGGVAVALVVAES